MTRFCRPTSFCCLAALAVSFAFPPWTVRYRWDRTKYERIQWAPVWLDSLEIYFLAAAPTRQRKYEEAQAQWKAISQSATTRQSAQAEAASAEEGPPGKNRSLDEIEASILARRRVAVEKAAERAASAPPDWPGFESVALCWDRLTAQLLVILFVGGAILSLCWRRGRPLSIPP